jgi:putative membrane-bound dehydrogenase-like protein
MAARAEEVPASPAPIAEPALQRRDLALELFAREPEIATPIGIAVDGQGRVWAIESNTHFPNPGYDRHPTDRVLVIEDLDGDGKADRFTMFADGFHQAMAIALGGPGKLFLATRRDVMLLEDTDGDGKADRRTFLARLATAEEYPHNGLSGFAFDDLGFLYFAIGENMGVAYRLVGSDGATVKGGPEGGSIFRMRPDGSGLERWATGFWNTFHLGFDAFGRLFAVDNDPDSRPPCRLLHIVRGGDYGYRRWLGRKGLHPFTAWNGELPGTLPMVSGTGEAPSGVVAYEHQGLPPDLQGTLIATSWGDHRIESYRLEARGASFRSRPDALVIGGDLFRPVGIATAPDGSLYFTDWVDKDYHVHGKGRIWRLRGKSGAARPAAANQLASAPTGPESAERYASLLSHPVRAVREEAARALSGREDGGRVAREVLHGSATPRGRYLALVILARRGELGAEGDASGLSDGSPEVRAAAMRLIGETRGLPAGALETLMADPSPAVRMEAILALGRGSERARAGQAAPEPGPEVTAILEKLLSDPDPFLAGAAIDGLARLVGSRGLLERMAEPEPRRRLGLLLALRRTGDPAGRACLERSLADPDGEVRRAAFQWVGEERLVEHQKRLEESFERGPVSRSLFDAYLAAASLLRGETPDGRDAVGRDEALLPIALDRSRPPALRALALRALSPAHPALSAAKLKGLLGEADPALKLEAARSLAESPLKEAQEMLRALSADAREPPAVRRAAIAGLSRFTPGSRPALEPLLADGDPLARREAERALRFSAAGGPAANAGRKPPISESERAALLAGGDAAEGEVIFFHPRGPRCSSCHTARGRGGVAGPDLSAAGLTRREKLLESILSPGREIAPQYATWTIETRAGLKVGTVLGEEPDGSIRLAAAEGQVELVPGEAIRSRSMAATSLMPEGLAGSLTTEELRDLLAFLESLR